MGNIRSAEPSIALQRRDIQLLQGLFECRVMSAAHLSTIYFDSKKEAAKKRLQRIKAAGLIAERRRKPFEPAVLSLARKGLEILRDRGVLTDYPAISFPQLQKRARVSDLTLRHELEVMDVKAALHWAIRETPNLSIAEFTTWPLLNEFTACRSRDGAEVLVKPDGFIRIHENEPDGHLYEHVFFLEVDRSTESLDTLIERAGCYLNYYRSGRFAEKSGGQRSEYREFPFRVLIALKSAERRNNVAERLLNSTPPILTQVCFSTIDRVTTDPLGPIWVRPKDYRIPSVPASSGYPSQKAKSIHAVVEVRHHRLLT